MFLPARVRLFGSGQVIQMAGFDAMDELAGLALRGNVVIPAARDVERIGESEDAVGERVTMVVVEEEPSIKAFGADCFL